MGREVRMVPKDYEHPKDNHGNLESLFDGADFEEELRDWKEQKAKWDEGFTKDFSNDGWKPRKESDGDSFDEWHGTKPDPKHYMPIFEEGTTTHFMMFETTSEGSPISPAFETPEELARWLTDNEASAFAGMGASYEGWLATITGGGACSAIITPGVGMISGVEANAVLKKKEDKDA